MKTLTEFKARLQPGTQVKQIWNSYEGSVDHVYTVVAVQSNGTWATRPDLSRRSWMSFPKRAEITFTENGWIRMEGTQRLAEYVWAEGKRES